DPAPPPVRRLDGHANAITRLLATPDGRWLISASYDHTIRCWDMEAASADSTTVVLNARAREEAASRKSGGKVPAGVEAKVEVQQEARVLEGHQDWVQGLALTPDGKVLVSGDDGGVVIVWDRPAGKEVRRWRIKGWAYALAVSPDAKRVVVSERVPLVFDSGRHAGVRLWDAATGQAERHLAGGTGQD